MVNAVAAGAAARAQTRRSKTLVGWGALLTKDLDCEMNPEPPGELPFGSKSVKMATALRLYRGAPVSSSLHAQP